MLSSRDPGGLGIYGFRNRSEYDYNSLYVADGSAVQVPRVWDILSEAGHESVAVSVPQTYPVRPINGHIVSGFLTPSTGSAFTYPAIYRQEILKQFPGYQFDVKGFRTDDKLWLRQQISDVTETQFKLLKHTLTTKSWDFAMFVNMGTDRIHHGFWRYHDPEHRLYEPGNPFESTIRDYYKQVDSHIVDILQSIGDDVTVMIVSDHGAKRMDGAICINEWLWREGWLVLNSPPPDGKITCFEDVDVDWTRTRAWSTGGYFGRIFLNIAGREPAGIIDPSAVESVCDELSAAVKAIPAPDGQPLRTQVFTPQEVYTSVNRIAPDLMVYFGDLHWRCVGSMGYDDIYTFSNDTGPDDANHSQDGMYLIVDPARSGSEHSQPHQLMDIAPTILQRMGIPIHPIMQGRVIAP